MRIENVYCYENCGNKSAEFTPSVSVTFQRNVDQVLEIGKAMFSKISVILRLWALIVKYEQL